MNLSVTAARPVAPALCVGAASAEAADQHESRDPGAARTPPSPRPRSMRAAGAAAGPDRPRPC